MESSSSQRSKLACISTLQDEIIAKGGVIDRRIHFNENNSAKVNIIFLL